MKVTITSTDQIVQLVTSSGTVPGRLWQGETESGISVQLIVTRVAAAKDQDLTQFEKELKEQEAPNQIQAFPLRMVI